MDSVFKNTCQFVFNYHLLPVLICCKQGQDALLTCHVPPKCTATPLRERHDICVRTSACGHPPGVVSEPELVIIIRNPIDFRRIARNSHHRFS